MASAAAPPPTKRLDTWTEQRPSGCGCPGCVRVVDHAPRCWRCRRPLLEAAVRPWLKKCDQCKAVNASPPR